jgi:hypothetical protein
VWELICHHTYKWYGQAIDLSSYNSHGVTDASFLPDGATPGSGALRFQPGNSVRVATSRAWRPLVGVRVECLIRCAPQLPAPKGGGWYGRAQTLVDADGAFNVTLHGGHLFAGFRGNPAVYPGTAWDGLATYKDGIDPGYRLLPGTWVRVFFEHDGLTQMRLAVDGMNVTFPRGVLSGIPGVGPKGISFGNTLGKTATFQGDIDEIKIWRLDPARMRRLFLDRPVDQETADCWARFV